MIRRKSREGTSRTFADGPGLSLRQIGCRYGTADLKSPPPMEKPEVRTARNPNLLFIMTDQQRRDALSCMGSRFVHTPSLDRLAVEGVRFTNAITPSPICVPARASVLTGLPTHQTGCITNPDRLRTPASDLTTFDDALTARGYTAEYIGKWHAPEALLRPYSRLPTSVSLDTFYRGYLAGKGYGSPHQGASHPYISPLSGQPYDPDPIDHVYRSLNLGRGHSRPEPGLPFGRDSVRAEHSVSAMIADETVRSIERLKGVPFSITSSFLFPHDPLIVPRPYCDSVRAADMATPETFDDARMNTPYKDFVWQMDDLERRHVHLLMARYYAAVQEVDRHIGRILDALDTSGLTDNTLVVFTSDHGEMLGDHGLMTKFVHYREAVGVPLLMRMPGRIPAGSTVYAPVCLTDLFATISDYLGVTPRDRWGRSLQSWIAGDAPEPDPIVFSQFEHWNVMAQTYEWKYVWSNHADEVDMLFDLTRDPGEVNNLLGANPDRARYLQQAAAMKERLAEWMEETEHPWLERLAATPVR